MRIPISLTIVFCLALLTASHGNATKPWTMAGASPVSEGGSCTALSKPQNFKASCNQPQGLKQCWEFTGSKWSNQTISKAACPGGSYSTATRCAAIVGRCLKNCGRDIEMVMFFSDGTAANWKASCEAKGRGTWLGK